MAAQEQTSFLNVAPEQPYFQPTAHHTYNASFQNNRTGLDSSDVACNRPSYPGYHLNNQSTVQVHHLEQPHNSSNLHHYVHRPKSCDVPSQSGVISSPDGYREGIAPDGVSSVSTELDPSNVSSRRKHGNWIMEACAMLVATGAVASIIGLLARYEGKPLPEWHFDLTLNALIGMLTTVANVAMAVVLSSGLGQLKWDLARRGFVPLADMGLLDEASRGAWGAVKLLCRLRGGMAGIFGAVAILVALLVSPFAQQIITYRNLPVASGISAVNYRGLNFTMALPSLDPAEPFVPVLPIKSAVYNGLFAEDNRPSSSLDITCPSGNCTWEAFDTLAVCSECVDMTPYMTKNCADGENECGWSLPTGTGLNGSDTFGMTNEFLSTYGGAPWSDIMQMTFMGTENNTGQTGNLEPWARQCTLSVCVQTIVSEVMSGKLTENITFTSRNQTVLGGSKSATELAPVVIAVDAASHNTSSAPASYTLSAEAMLSMQSWFAKVFTNGSATRTGAAVNTSLTSAANAAVAVNLTVGISSGATFFDADVVQAFYWNYYEYPMGLDMLVQDVAVSLTVAFRSLTGAVGVNGTAWTGETFIHVYWGFVTPLILSILLTMALLVQMMLYSRDKGSPLWKSSALAMLLHGLDGYTKSDLHETSDLNIDEKTAGRLRVRLDGSISGGSLKAEMVY